MKKFSKFYLVNSSIFRGAQGSATHASSGTPYAYVPPSMRGGSAINHDLQRVGFLIPNILNFSFVYFDFELLFQASAVEAVRAIAAQTKKEKPETPAPAPPPPAASQAEPKKAAYVPPHLRNRT